jgi:hypothetical protein
MRKRVDRHGIPGPYGVRYSWVYWAAIAAAFALLIDEMGLMQQIGALPSESAAVGY